MPHIFPFKALRPSPDFVNLVTAKSTDFFNQEDLVHEIRTNSFTFHHVTKSHLSYSGAFQEPEKFLPFAAKYIKDMKAKGVFIKEDEDAFYVYEQIRKDGKVFKGLIALCSVEDYKANKIKKHEEIRPSRLKFLVELFKTTKVMGEPTLLAHNGAVPLDISNAEQLYSFTTLDDKHHVIYKISEKVQVADIQAAMAAIDNLYIADGHHRSASTKEFNASVVKLENNKSMCCIMHEDDLEILPFHRLLKPIMTVTTADIIKALSYRFDVSVSAESLYEIKNRNEFGLYVNKQWYQLKLKISSDLPDVQVLENYVVRGIFKIADSRIDSQISFHPHTAGETLLKNLIDVDTYSLAITMKACNFGEVRLVADQNNTMPPKSTYIEPKLRAGLIIQEFGIIKK
ncbi:MAG: hypothetical protein ACI96L_000162 [Paracoccaceae bacterium]